MKMSRSVVMKHPCI